MNLLARTTSATTLNQGIATAPARAPAQAATWSGWAMGKVKAGGTAVVSSVANAGISTLKSVVDVGSGMNNFRSAYNHVFDIPVTLNGIHIYSESATERFSNAGKELYVGVSKLAAIGLVVTGEMSKAATCVGLQTPSSDLLHLGNIAEMAATGAEMAVSGSLSLAGSAVRTVAPYVLPTLNAVVTPVAKAAWQNPANSAAIAVGGALLFSAGRDLVNATSSAPKITTKMNGAKVEVTTEYPTAWERSKTFASGVTKVAAVGAIVVGTAMWNTQAS